MPVENCLPENIPHRDIWPLKITGKIRLFAEKEAGGPFISPEESP
jgi:hypothetical protein